MLINSPPSEDALVQLRVKILNISNAHPNLKVQFENGRVEYIEFPSAMYDPIRGFSNSVHYMGDLQRTKLVGCSATLGVEAMQGLVAWNRRRAWRVLCGEYSISYQELLREYDLDNSTSSVIKIIENLFLCGWVFLFFYSDRKKSWASQ